MRSDPPSSRRAAAGGSGAGGASDRHAGAAWPAGFVDGVRAFNAGQYYEAHEAFEALLDDVEQDARWDLLVALVQVAVGYHKWSSGHPGAARMLRLGLDKLATWPALAYGVRLDALRARVTADLQRIDGATTADAGTPPRILLTPPGGA